jgi:hypothetical protein
MSPDTPIREVEDFSMATVELLQKHAIATLGELTRWTPPPDIHPLIFTNIEAVLDDLGYDWPSPRILA